MKKPVRVRQEEAMATPAQVWETLTMGQQKTVMQTVVAICRTLMAQWVKEQKHEPVPHP